MKKIIFAISILFASSAINYAFSESETKAREDGIPIGILIDEKHRVEKILTEQQCSADTAKMIEYLIGLYNAESYQPVQMSKPEGFYVDYFLMYAKLGYIYSLSNDSIESEYNYYKAKQYGVKFDKKLENRDYLISIMKKATLYCIVEPVEKGDSSTAAPLIIK